MKFESDFIFLESSGESIKVSGRLFDKKGRSIILITQKDSRGSIVETGKV